MRSANLMLAMTASSFALAAFAAPRDGGGSGPPLKTDPNPQPLAPGPALLSGDPAAAPSPDPIAAAVGVVDAPPPAPPAPPPPSPPATKPVQEPPSSAKSRKGRTVVVWAQPGHERFGIGQMLRMPTEEAEQLRGAGRARYASEDEAKLAGDRIADVEGV